MANDKITSNEDKISRSSENIYSTEVNSISGVDTDPVLNEDQQIEEDIEQSESRLRQAGIDQAVVDAQKDQAERESGWFEKFILNPILAPMRFVEGAVAGGVADVRGLFGDEDAYSSLFDDEHKNIFSDVFNSAIDSVQKDFLTSGEHLGGDTLLKFIFTGDPDTTDWSGWGRFFGSLPLDIALDPLTYLGAPLFKYTAKGIGKTAKTTGAQLENLLSPEWKSAKAMTGKTNRELRETVQKDLINTGAQRKGISWDEHPELDNLINTKKSMFSTISEKFKNRKNLDTLKNHETKILDDNYDLVKQIKSAITKEDRTNIIRKYAGEDYSTRTVEQLADRRLSKTARVRQQTIDVLNRLTGNANVNIKNVRRARNNSRRKDIFLQNQINKQTHNYQKSIIKFVDDTINNPNRDVLIKRFFKDSNSFLTEPEIDEIVNYINKGVSSKSLTKSEKRAFIKAKAELGLQLDRYVGQVLERGKSLKTYEFLQDTALGNSKEISKMKRYNLGFDELKQVNKVLRDFYGNDDIILWNYKLNKKPKGKLDTLDSFEQFGKSADDLLTGTFDRKTIKDLENRLWVFQIKDEQKRKDVLRLLDVIRKNQLSTKKGTKAASKFPNLDDFKDEPILSIWNYPKKAKQKTTWINRLPQKDYQINKLPFYNELMSDSVFANMDISPLNKYKLLSNLKYPDVGAMDALQSELILRNLYSDNYLARSKRRFLNKQQSVPEIKQNFLKDNFESYLDDSGQKIELKNSDDVYSFFANNGTIKALEDGTFDVSFPIFSKPADKKRFVLGQGNYDELNKTLKLNNKTYDLSSKVGLDQLNSDINKLLKVYSDRYLNDVILKDILKQDIDLSLDYFDVNGKGEWKLYKQQANKSQMKSLKTRITKLKKELEELGDLPKIEKLEEELSQVEKILEKNNPIKIKNYDTFSTIEGPPITYFDKAGKQKTLEIGKDIPFDDKELLKDLKYAIMYANPEKSYGYLRKHVLLPNLKDPYGVENVSERMKDIKNTFGIDVPIDKAASINIEHLIKKFKEEYPKFKKIEGKTFGEFSDNAWAKYPSGRGIKPLNSFIDKGTKEQEKIISKAIKDFNKYLDDRVIPIVEDFEKTSLIERKNKIIEQLDTLKSNVADNSKLENIKGVSKKEASLNKRIEDFEEKLDSLNFSFGVDSFLKNTTKNKKSILNNPSIKRLTKFPYIKSDVKLSNLNIDNLLSPFAKKSESKVYKKRFDVPDLVNKEKVKIGKKGNEFFDVSDVDNVKKLSNLDIVNLLNQNTLTMLQRKLPKKIDYAKLNESVTNKINKDFSKINKPDKRLDRLQKATTLSDAIENNRVFLNRRLLNFDEGITGDYIGKDGISRSFTLTNDDVDKLSQVFRSDINVQVDDDMLETFKKIADKRNEVLDMVNNPTKLDGSIKTDIKSLKNGEGLSLSGNYINKEGFKKPFNILSNDNLNKKRLNKNAINLFISNHDKNDLIALMRDGSQNAQDIISSFVVDKLHQFDINNLYFKNDIPYQRSVDKDLINFRKKGDEGLNLSYITPDSLPSVSFLKHNDFRKKLVDSLTSLEKTDIGSKNIDNVLKNVFKEHAELFNMTENGFNNFLANSPLKLKNEMVNSLSNTLKSNLKDYLDSLESDSFLKRISNTKRSPLNEFIDSVDTSLLKRRLFSYGYDTRPRTRVRSRDVLSKDKLLNMLEKNIDLSNKSGLNKTVRTSADNRIKNMFSSADELDSLISAGRGLVSNPFMSAKQLAENPDSVNKYIYNTDFFGNTTSEEKNLIRNEATQSVRDLILSRRPLSNRGQGVHQAEDIGRAETKLNLPSKYMGTSRGVNASIGLDAPFFEESLLKRTASYNNDLRNLYKFDKAMLEALSSGGIRFGRDIPDKYGYKYRKLADSKALSTLNSELKRNPESREVIEGIFNDFKKKQNVRVGIDDAGELVFKDKEGLDITDNLYIQKNIDNLLKRNNMSITADDLSDLGNLYDSFMRGFKSSMLFSPGYIARVFFGNLTQQILAGSTIADFVKDIKRGTRELPKYRNFSTDLDKARNIVRKELGTENLFRDEDLLNKRMLTEGTKENDILKNSDFSWYNSPHTSPIKSYDEALNLYNEIFDLVGRGVLENVYFKPTRSSFARLDLNLRDIDDVRNSFIPNFAQKHPRIWDDSNWSVRRLGRLPINATMNMTDASRLGSYLNLLDNPSRLKNLGFATSKEGASDWVKEAYFDIMRLNNFEEKYMTRLIPFYRFWRLSTEQQLKNLAKLNLMPYEKMLKTFRDAWIGTGQFDEGALGYNQIPEYAIQEKWMPIRTDKETGKVTTLKTGYTPNTLFNLISNPSSNIATELFSQANPFIKFFIDMAAGQNLFTGEEYDNRFKQAFNDDINIVSSRVEGLKNSLQRAQDVGKGNPVTDFLPTMFYSYDPSEQIQYYHQYQRSLLSELIQSLQAQGVLIPGYSESINYLYDVPNLTGWNI